MKNIDLDKTVELAEKIMILRGSGSSGNWGHTGRPGKRGGSGGGGGFGRIGLKNRDRGNVGKIRKLAKSHKKAILRSNNGKKLLNKVKHGGTLKLTAGDLDVDVSIKSDGGVMGMAVKEPGKKKFGKHFIRSSNDIENYLGQFEERTGRKKAAKEFREGRKGGKSQPSGKTSRKLEDAIGEALGAEFSGSKLRQVKDLDPKLYKSLKARGVKRLEKQVDDLDATLKFSKARISVLEKQKKKAKSTGRSFNPLKSAQLRNLSDNIPLAEAELKNLNELLKNKSDVVMPESSGHATDIGSLLDLDGLSKAT